MKTLTTTGCVHLHPCHFLTITVETSRHGFGKTSAPSYRTTCLRTWQTEDRARTRLCIKHLFAAKKRVFPVNLSLHLLYKSLERRLRKKNAERSHRGDPNCEGETRGADRRRLIADAAQRADSAAPAAAAAAAQSIQPTEAERDRGVGRRERELGM